MDKNKVKLLFEDMTYSSSYELLEEGRNLEELKEIAAKKGLVVPSKDLAIFKGRYAMVDKENKNKCTLPRKEVKKALKTLNGKAVDKDHLRGSVIGHWLDAELDGDEIITYATFFKSNFPEDFEVFKEKMSSGKMKISFEAWGNRVFKENDSYDLTDIEFAGRALLYETNPAFPEAEVLELSNKVLEFAKVIEEGEAKKKEDTQMLEESKLNFYADNNLIARMMFEADCPNCKAQAAFDINSIDFDNSKINGTCFICNTKATIDLTPQISIVKKGKKIETVKSNVVDSQSKSINTLKEGGDKIMDEQLKKYGKATVEETANFLASEFESLKKSIEAKDSEIASLKEASEALKKELATVKTEVETAKAEAKTSKDALDAKLAVEKAALVKARKDELGEEFAKDMKDEDILDDVKFELAKSKKTIATLTKEKASLVQGGLEAGATELTPETPSMKKQKSIQEKAFGKQ